MTDSTTFTKPVLTETGDGLASATYTTDPLIYSYPDTEYVTVLETDKNPGATIVGTLTHTDNIHIDYETPTRVRVRSLHYTQDDFGVWSEWSDPITVSPPALVWTNTGQLDLNPHEPKRYEGYGAPDESGVDLSESEFGDTYTDLDTGMFYELSASDGTFGTPFDGPPDAPAGLTVTSTSEDTLAGNVRLEWPTAAHADWYDILWREYIAEDQPVDGTEDGWSFLWSGITTSYTAHVYIPGSWQFLVLAANNLLNGGNSTGAFTGEVVVETASTTHGPEALPGPAENLQVADNAPASVTFTWEPPADSRLGDASWYIVEHSADGSEPWDMIGPAAAFPGLTTTVTDLATGSYHFHLLSLNDYGSAVSDSIGPVAVESE